MLYREVYIEIRYMCNVRTNMSGEGSIFPRTLKSKIKNYSVIFMESERKEEFSAEKIHARHIGSETSWVLEKINFMIALYAFVDDFLTLALGNDYLMVKYATNCWINLTVPKGISFPKFWRR